MARPPKGRETKESREEILRVDKRKGEGWTDRERLRLLSVPSPFSFTVKEEKSRGLRREEKQKKKKKERKLRDGRHQNEEKNEKGKKKEARTKTRQRIHTKTQASSLFLGFAHYLSLFYLGGGKKRREGGKEPLCFIGMKRSP